MGNIERAYERFGQDSPSDPVERYPLLSQRPDVIQDQRSGLRKGSQGASPIRVANSSGVLAPRVAFGWTLAASSSVSSKKRTFSRSSQSIGQVAAGMASKATLR